MAKIVIEKSAFCLPWTQTLLGICVGNGHASNAAIRETGQCSVHIPTVDMMAVTDYCGIVSAKHADKSKLFEVFSGELESAPMIADCPLTMECTLVPSIDVPTNTLFIGEIMHSCSEEKYLENGRPDVRKVRPFLLTMPDNRSWAVGEQVGNAWKDGVKYKEQRGKQ